MGRRIKCLSREASLPQVEAEMPSPVTGVSLPAIVENMAEFRPEMCTEAAQQGLLQWLLKRLKVRGAVALPLTRLGSGCHWGQGVDGTWQPLAIWSSLGSFWSPFCCLSSPSPLFKRFFFEFCFLKPSIVYILSVIFLYIHGRQYCMCDLKRII